MFYNNRLRISLIVMVVGLLTLGLFISQQSPIPSDKTVSSKPYELPPSLDGGYNPQQGFRL